MEKLTYMQLREYFFNNRKYFDELGIYYSKVDPQYYNDVFLGYQTLFQKAKRNNNITKLILILLFVIAFIALVISSEKNKKSTTLSKTDSSQSTTKNLNDDTSNFEKARERGKKYLEAQKRSKETDQIKIEYKSKLNCSCYQYEVEERLLSNRFYQTRSEFEKAPDGSTNVKTYYEKKENDFLITVTLQPSYSLKSYYFDISVKDVKP